MPFPLLDTIEKSATVLRDAGLPFTLAGAVRAFEASGMRVEQPPGGRLLKAFDGDRMTDLIFRSVRHPGPRALLGRPVLLRELGVLADDRDAEPHDAEPPDAGRDMGTQDTRAGR